MKQKPYKLILYTAKDGPRWRMKRKGRIVAEGGESYDSPSKLRRAVKRLMDELFGAGQVEVIDELD